MLEVYSLFIDVDPNAAIPLNNVVIEKGCTATLSAPATIQLNKAGVYMVSVDASSTESATIQLYKDGVPLPQAQSTGMAIGFTTLIQVQSNNSNCPCSSPTILQLTNTGEAAATYDNVNVVVTKVC